ncbi:MAG: SRPBCC domain-containing protein, partial [Actinomycetota bacterium]
MDLKHTFTVNQPIAETWAVVTDLERIAPCLPGAQLQEVHGDVFKGVIKIKVGPIVAQFKGEAQFADK